MVMQNMLLSATAEQATVDAVTTEANTDATATSETTENTATTEATTDSTTEAPAEDGTADISIEGTDGVTTAGDDVTNITVNENGELVIQNPETGEETPLTEDQINALANMSTETVLPVQQPLSAGLTGLYIVYAIFCVGLIALILSQKKRSAAFGNGMSSGGSDTYWSKNKGRSMEGRLDTITKVGFAIFLAFTFVLTII